MYVYADNNLQSRLNISIYYYIWRRRLVSEIGVEMLLPAPAHLGLYFMSLSWYVVSVLLTQVKATMCRIWGEDAVWLQICVLVDTNMAGDVLRSLWKHSVPLFRQKYQLFVVFFHHKKAGNVPKLSFKCIQWSHASINVKNTVSRCFKVTNVETQSWTVVTGLAAFSSSCNTTTIPSTFQYGSHKHLEHYQPTFYSCDRIESVLYQRSKKKKQNKKTLFRFLAKGLRE